MKEKYLCKASLILYPFHNHTHSVIADHSNRLFFFGNYMAGNMAGYELAALFVIGIALIGVEIFVIPGFGVAGITGLLLLVGAVVFSM
ncbi:hypothetical protein OAG12_00575, partial [Akkermansiaceae bacterium]|nr:hypothetical protein [Akkermansiaceae bacterium]